MTDATMTAAPSATTERIFNLDMLRGLAVLGILAVNCLAFAWPGEIISMREAMPFVVDGANETALWVERVFFEGKWRTLFSMLFGVSIFLVGGERSNEERGAHLQRRLLWLLAFGLAHGVLIWSGDILLHYAYCGFIMMMMRSWSAGRPQQRLWPASISAPSFSDRCSEWRSRAPDGPCSPECPS